MNYNSVMYSFFRFAFVCILLVVFFGVVRDGVASGFIFTRNLSLGDTGADVYELQRVLNENERTFVAAFGPGSPSNETMYFGPATQNAVIKFQNKYAGTVLFSQGLSVGTGVVDDATRAMLNSLSGSLSGAIAIVSPPVTFQATTDFLMQDQVGAAFVTSPFPTPTQSLSNIDQFNLFSEDDNKKVQIAFISSNAGHVGATVELMGTGFVSSGNKIHFGKEVVPSIDSKNNNTIVFNIPSSIGPGVYDIEVSNSKGKSKSNTYFVVTANNQIKSPVVTSVSPTRVSVGDTITIVGENFTATNNTIHSTLGTFSNIPSKDGKTVSLTLTAPSHIPELELLLERIENYEFKVFLYAVNNNGSSDKQAPVVVTLE